MRTMLALFLVAVVSACSGRTVEVQTAPTPTGDLALQVTNNASQAVNVYVTSGGNDIFVGQVPANSSQHLPVSGVASGSNVTLKARTADGTREYTKSNVALSGTYAWQVP
jgi:hypothetical protein